MREAGKSYLWCTEPWFRTKPGTTPRTQTVNDTVSTSTYYKQRRSTDIQIVFFSMQKS